MTLYTYVPGKAELLDLMVDALWLAMPRERRPHGVLSVADANRALYAAHPWAARVTTSRPPLGPGLLAKYEHELGAFVGLGLSDVDMDAALTLVLGFVQGIAAQEPATTPRRRVVGGRRSAPRRGRRPRALPAGVARRHRGRRGAGRRLRRRARLPVRPGADHRRAGTLTRFRSCSTSAIWRQAADGRPHVRKVLLNVTGGLSVPGWKVTRTRRR